MANLVNHLNIPDKNGYVYCRAFNDKLNFKNMNKVRRRCFNCEMFAGTYQGQGVECVWDDAGVKVPIMRVTSFEEEFNRLNQR